METDVTLTDVPEDVDVPDEIANALNEYHGHAKKKSSKFTRNITYLDMAAKRKKKTPKHTPISVSTLIAAEQLAKQQPSQNNLTVPPQKNYQQQQTQSNMKDAF